MSTVRWKITLQVYRQKGKQTPHYDNFEMEADPDEYVLDVVERAWAYHDHTICFRHACHHSTCGACGMRVNGVEKLTCITKVASMIKDGGMMRVEPLRNFPVVSDLAVDMGSFYSRMELVGHREVLPITEVCVQPDTPSTPALPTWPEGYERLSDCISCGLCISACPVSATDPDYLGPGVLAGAQQNGLACHPELLPVVDGENGVWRCHSAFECTAVCPSYVEPAWRIMDLRKQVIRHRIWQFFHPVRKLATHSEEASK
ncbi:MAG: succinate dehydrogenase/fumarate reductase iron-sulfur subunit [Syntrophothermus sp.]